MANKSSEKTPKEYEKDIRFLQKQLNNALEKYDEAKALILEEKLQRRDFFSKINHAVRTPMNSISGYSDLLLFESIDEKQLLYAKQIKSSTNRMLSLFSDIVDLSNIEAGLAFLNEQEYSVETLLKTMVHNARMEASLKGIDFRIHVDTNIPSMLFGDFVHIQQVVNNLIDNAIKHTVNGYVFLDIICEKIDFGCRLCFIVKDTGCGMNSSQREALENSIRNFNPKSPYIHRDMGPGLITSCYFSKLMNGEITFTSKYGKGSTFICTISQKIINPISLTSHFIHSLEWDITKILSAPSAKVLVVDDSKVNLSVAANLLKCFDINTDTSTGGYSALRMIEETKYDIIFMDHMMPDIDGIETTEKIRSHKGSYYKSLPIVALTANATDEARHLFIEHGFSDFMSKPIEKDIINDMLYKWLPKSKISSKEDPMHKEQFQDKFTIAFEKAGINIDEGFEHSGGIMEQYVEIIKTLCNESNNYITNLSLFSESKDLKNYAIYAHGLKGALATIGATTLSSYAKEHELKAKEGDIAYVTKNSSELISRFKRLIDLINDIITSYDLDNASEASVLEENKAMSLEEIQEELKIVKENIENYEVDVALEILNNVKKHKLSVDMINLLESIEGKIDDFEYGDAIEIIDKNQD